MLDKISMYKELVIIPLEEKREELREEILTATVFSKGKKMELLQKYDELLQEKYQKLEEMMEKESR